ncbi:helix-turn-helix transcriptional regulator [Pseudanabaenaceae cyanobacterium LEGE 13415]|nr:helix-turn-helix transcriptional regulator [Pseudanabaenaceae cyanobacterium LEGE 13415]
MTVRNTIKQFIESRGISVYRFRIASGISQSTAYDLANEPTRIPNAEVLNKICNAYQVQPGELLEWIPDAENK